MDAVRKRAIKMVSVLILFSPLLLSAQDKLAMINDRDGYTLVRSGKGIEYNVIDTLFADEFFYFLPSGGSDWVKVVAWKGRQLNGFIHKSRVQEVGAMDLKNQRQLILKVLDRQKDLADDFQESLTEEDSLSYSNSRRELEMHGDAKYDQILRILPDYFCRTHDIDVLQHFFATMWADKGSANEMPSYAIGKCFACNPELVIDQLRKTGNKEQKINIIDQIEWGLMNNFDVPETRRSENPVYDKLKWRLDEERKNAGIKE